MLCPRPPKKLARPLVLALAGLAAAVAATPARADAIDGEWCRESRHFVIEGANILTWGGTRMSGDYSRHGFRYTIPANEPEAGTEVVMVLRGEEHVDVMKRSGGRDGPFETWRRCKVTS